jgi:fructan beta-fructosidase
MRPLAITLSCLLAIVAAADKPRADVVFADFEGDDYGDWKTTGTAFGKGPAKGTLPNQMPVTGFKGKGLVNSYHGGDASTGRLTSPEFTVSRKYVSFLIGGGGHAGKTCMNLLVGGKVVRTATGTNTKPGGSEELEPAGWDVGEFAGKKAKIEIVDEATGGWGHVNVDHIVFTDTKPPVPQVNPSRELTAQKRYLHLPVKNGGKSRHVRVLVGDKVEREFDVALADDKADWWAALDVSAYKGKKLKLTTSRLPAGSKAFESVEQGDELKDAKTLYREPLRPQLRFSAKRGWLNDPNGLVYYKGEYHLFFQHNPYGWDWGNMHWGHAVSKDLVHWQELGDALYPDAMGPMFSGSAVVDRDNTSGLGKEGKPALVLFYTAAGNPAVQCLAHSTDGRAFTKFADNPVVKQFTPGNRDPKVVWHAPTKRWVMVLYVERDRKHTIEFLTSPDLKKWTPRSRIEGFFECPDLFELPLDGDSKKAKWVLTAASSEYVVGSFDGETFKPETKKQPGHRGRGFYAAQTFSDLPASDSRRVQIGWLQAPSPGMAFNQCMSVPLSLGLVTTKDGPRLTMNPVKELEKLHGKAHKAGPLTLKPDARNPLAEADVELLELVASLEPDKKTVVEFVIRGIVVRYDSTKQELTVNGHKAPAPLRDGKVDVRVLVDRTATEAFASGGLTYVPMPVIPKADNRGDSVSVTGGDVKFSTLDVFELKSIWEGKR